MDTLQSNLNTEKPCLIETQQGFTVLYKNRYLYSKYNPSKSINQIIDRLDIFEDTLVVAYSPCLCYGLNKLREKLRNNCYVILIENDKKLFELASESFDKVISDKKNITLVPHDKIQTVSAYIFSDERAGAVYNYKRVISVDLSGGTFFYNTLYTQITSLLQNYISTFWKNQLTLTKLGRLFSRNIFKNIRNLSESISLYSLCKTIEKPIFVFGAGESIEHTLSTIKPELLHKCFILTVDAAIPLLQKCSIRIDGIIAVESQHAIQKAYIGYKNSNQDTIVFADMTSREQVARYTKNKLCYFTSKYANLRYIDNLSRDGILPPFVPPMGSVGLTAVYTAILLRQNSNVPIFFTGLDFSYSTGKTHGKGTYPFIIRLCKTNRLFQLENIDASYKNGSKGFTDKYGNKMKTDLALYNYAQQFSAQFKNIPNLFDTGNRGIKLISNIVDDEDLINYLTNVISKENKLNLTPFVKNTDYIRTYLSKELSDLVTIKEILQGSYSGDKKLKELLEIKDYLYSHFPDGYKLQDNISFYKRIRSELDFFIKDITLSVKHLR